MRLTATRLSPTSSHAVSPNATANPKRKIAAADALEPTTGTKRVKRDYPHPVVVAGGSIAGLSAALQLAKLGLKVVVLEARLDPESAAGKAKLASDQSSKVWGTRERTIVLDQHAIASLRSLGVSTTTFPAMRYLEVRPSGELSPHIDVNYAHGAGKNGNGRLDHKTIVSARDISHQPLISELEHALLDAARKNPNIDVVFDAKVVGRTSTKSGVTVRYGDNQTMNGTMLVVADGGGKNSVTNQLGVERYTWANETISTVTLTASGRAVGNHPVHDAGSAAGLTENGWYGLNTDGRKNVTVNVRSSGKKRPENPLDVAREQGVRGTAKAPVSTFSAPIDGAKNVALGNRTFIIGDAALRGTPLFGFGGQFALLWGQTIADMCSHGLDKNGLPTEGAVRWFARKADDICATRLAYEAGFNDAFDSALATPDAIASALASADLASALTKLDMRMSDGRLHLDVGFDTRPLFAKNASRQTQGALGDLVVGRLTGKPAAEFADGTITLHPTPQSPITFKTQRETVKITGGTLALNLGTDGEVVWSSVTLKRTVASTGHQSTIEVPHMSVKLPGALLARAAASAPALARSKDVSGTVTLASGDMKLGPLEVRFANDPIVNFWLERVRGGMELRMDFERGTMSLLNAADLSHMIGALQQGRDVASAIGTGNIFVNAVINAVGSSAHVDQAIFTLADDGSANAYYHTNNSLIGSRSFDLPREHVEALASYMQQLNAGSALGALQSKVVDFDVKA